MKFITIVLLVIPAIYAAAVPEPAAEPDSNLVRRQTCTRKLKHWPDKKGVCVDTTKRNACIGGELYKANCGPDPWFCCIP
jgi:hypothetical protein